MDNKKDDWEMDKDARFMQSLQEFDKEPDKAKTFVEVLKKFQRECMRVIKRR